MNETSLNCIKISDNKREICARLNINLSGDNPLTLKLKKNGKSLQNRTYTTLSLENWDTKYVQKTLKIVQKLAKKPKIAQQM